MSQYFVTGNIWLTLALLAFIGKKYERSDPTMYSVFGVGRYFYPHQYTMLIATLGAAAAACFLLHWRRGRLERGAKL